MAGDGGGCGHLRRDEVSAATAALTALEVAVAGGGAALAGRENVRVHAETHGTARLAPLKACFKKDLVEAFLFSLRLDGLGAGNNHCADGGSHLAAGGDFGGGAEVFDAAVGAGADEDAIDTEAIERGPGGEPHVVKGRLPGLALGFVCGVGGIGHGGCYGRDHAGAGAPANVWDE